ncbi:Cu2+-exporting ATPase [Rhizodiscina lignyota]|uniref:Cu2+-exporting ATPase n=1 Tax=Rhizodiscina lignyota TaxID=1504668 RepID=A0A9P4M8F5_9PEZI|nr:Cu2+-exporting ATPase [Rhizodiscina lignyota]
MDIEKGPPQYEKAVLTVQGMTCSGCEKNIEKAIAAIPGTRNINSSVVLARAEFEIDTNRTAVEDAISTLHQTTTYTCTRVSETKEQYLDVIISDAKSFCDRSPPKGITGISMVSAQKVRISYDPSEIGARHLVENVFSTQLDLAPLEPPISLTAGKRQVRREGYLFLASAILTVPVLVLGWAPLPEKGSRPVIYTSISLALASIVQLGVALEFYTKAFKSLVYSRLLEVDALIVLSTTAAYVFSLIIFALDLAGMPLNIGQFFETSTLLVSIIMLGRFVSELSRHKAMESVSVRSLQSTTALIYTNRERTMTREIDVRLLEHSDVFRVAPESRIVTDGTVVYGGSEVDESMVTGEPIPVAKSIDSQVVAGSVNGFGALDVALTKLPFENTISTIATMVDEAELSKPRSQAIADQFAGYFVPVVLVITVVVFVIQILVRKFALRVSAADAAVDAITYAIATLIVSCPCAIGLAVPMVVVIASGVTAKRGVVMKDPQMVEIARKTTHVVFDKTGTLTEESMTVTAEYYEYNGGPSVFYGPLIATLAAGTKHPISAAINHHLCRRYDSAQNLLKNIKSVPGKGIQAEGEQDTMWRLGSPEWTCHEQHPEVKKLLAIPGTSVVCVTRGDHLVAVFGLSNTIRREARTVVDRLRSQGVAVSIVSGDNLNAVHYVADQLNIGHSDAIGRCSPADKDYYIRGICAQNPNAVVMFCGDGTNDAPALKRAHVGVHIAEGTDIAGAAANVVLVRPDLRGVLLAIDVSKAAYRRIVFNFSWSALYNLLALTMAAGAWVKFRIPPAYAALGEIVSVLPVIGIALSLRWSKFGQRG